MVFFSCFIIWKKREKENIFITFSIYISTHTSKLWDPGWLIARSAASTVLINFHEHEIRHRKLLLFPFYQWQIFKNREFYFQVFFICTLWKPRDQIKSFLRAAYGVSLNGRSVHYSFNQNDKIWRRCRAFSHRGHSLLILGPSLLSVCRFWVKGDEIWNCHNYMTRENSIRKHSLSSKMFIYTKKEPAHNRVPFLADYIRMKLRLDIAIFKTMVIFHFFSYS